MPHGSQDIIELRDTCVDGKMVAEIWSRGKIVARKNGREENGREDGRDENSSRGNIRDV